MLRTAISDIEVCCVVSLVDITYTFNKASKSSLSFQVDYEDIKGRTLLKVPGYEDPMEFGVLTSFAYSLEGNLGEIVVATTRVETMLGDTAIAVHPDDSRYKHLHNKVAVHPFNGRRIPIICDAILVDPAFGTGAVKVKVPTTCDCLLKKHFVWVT